MLGAINRRLCVLRAPSESTASALGGQCLAINAWDRACQQ